MESLTLARAHIIVDSICHMFTTGEWGMFDADFPCEKVGVSSRAEALAALFLETAYNYQQAVLRFLEDEQSFKDFLNAMGSISMTISVCQKSETSKDHALGVFEEFKNLETIESFFNFLKRQDTKAPDYWHLVFARVKLQLPHVDIALDLNPVEKHPVLAAITRLILTLFGYGVGLILAVCLQIGAVILAYSTIKPAVDALGGSLLFEGLGWVVAIVMVIIIMIAVIAPVVWVMNYVEERWPNNAIKRLVNWVKAGPVNETSSYNSEN